MRFSHWLVFGFWSLVFPGVCRVVNNLAGEWGYSRIAIAEAGASVFLRDRFE